MLTPAERTLRARLAAHAMHASHNSKAVSQPARDAWLAKFEAAVDPAGELSPEDRARRAEHARKSYMLGLALKSAKARRRG